MSPIRDSVTEPQGEERRRPVWWLWALLMAGPVIWYLHFWGVYLVAEWVCSLGGLGFRFLGLSGLSVVVLGATLVAVLVAAGLVWRAGLLGSEAPESDELGIFVGRGGVMLGLLFIVALLFVGLPALVLVPC